MDKRWVMENKLINEKIGKLKEWKYTESLNEILFDTLSRLSDYSEARFKDFIDQIKSETVLHTETPEIKFAVCTEENLDEMLYLYPVSVNLPFKNPDYIATIFAECDYLTIQELMSKRYTAEIKVKKRKQKIQIGLRYSLKYLQRIEFLHYIFNANELSWSTLNSIYLYKFLDVYCVDDIDISEIESFEIDFGQYAKYVSYDKILLWNVEQMNVPAASVSTEAKPTYNAVQFEHTIKNLQLDEHKYLVCYNSGKFTSFRQGKLLCVRTYDKQIEQIGLLRIVNGSGDNYNLYLQPKSNKKEIGFIDALAMRRYVPTRGEAERITHSLYPHTGLHLENIKVLPNTKENISKYKNIEYNFFIEDSVFLREKKLLLFSFHSDDTGLWLYEKMFFVLSELQLYFYEYHCIGEIL